VCVCACVRACVRACVCVCVCVLTDGKTYNFLVATDAEFNDKAEMFLFS